MSCTWGVVGRDSFACHKCVLHASYPHHAPPKFTVYVGISYRLFHLTNDLKMAVVPHKCNRLLLRNSVLLGITAAVAWAAGTVLSKAANDSV